MLLKTFAFNNCSELGRGINAADALVAALGFEMLDKAGEVVSGDGVALDVVCATVAADYDYMVASVVANIYSSFCALAD
jgi:hypothetical protein